MSKKIDSEELILRIESEMITPVFDSNDWHFNRGLQRAIDVINNMPVKKGNPWENGEEFD